MVRHGGSTRGGITLTDKEIIANPYRCFEADRDQEDPIPLRTIDRGLFPDENITAAIPVPEPSTCKEPIDPRVAERSAWPHLIKPPTKDTPSSHKHGSSNEYGTWK